MLIEPFDYIELLNGDLVCAMWNHRCSRKMLGCVIYTLMHPTGCSEERTLNEIVFRKIYHNKNRRSHDDYVDKFLSDYVVHDSIGGKMVSLTDSIVKRRISAKDEFATLLENKDYRSASIVEFLGIDPNYVGVTGSTLLKNKEPDDFDIVVYECGKSPSVADRIREHIDCTPLSRVKGYWGKHHHRRFTIDDIIYCVKCPLPDRLIDTYTAPSKPFLFLMNAEATICDDDYGHCSPCLYHVDIHCSDGDTNKKLHTIALLSADSSHSFAFKNGDRVLLKDVLIRQIGSTLLAGVQMGDHDAITPI